MSHPFRPFHGLGGKSYLVFGTIDPCSFRWLRQRTVPTWNVVTQDVSFWGGLGPSSNCPWWWILAPPGDRLGRRVYDSGTPTQPWKKQAPKPSRAPTSQSHPSTDSEMEFVPLVDWRAGTLFLDFHWRIGKLLPVDWSVSGRASGRHARGMPRLRHSAIASRAGWRPSGAPSTSSGGAETFPGAPASGSGRHRRRKRACSGETDAPTRSSAHGCTRRHGQAAQRGQRVRQAPGTEAERQGRRAAADQTEHARRCGRGGSMPAASRPNAPIAGRRRRARGDGEVRTPAGEASCAAGIDGGAGTRSGPGACATSARGMARDGPRRLCHGILRQLDERGTHVA
eukprot:scaffold1353_cov363-Pavlova_lutheri.AAC.4